LAGDLLQAGLKLRGFESQRGGSSEAIRRVFLCLLPQKTAACDTMNAMRAARIHTTARAPQKATSAIFYTLLCMSNTSMLQSSKKFIKTP
jgi:hypothetical protein